MMSALTLLTLMFVAVQLNVDGQGAATFQLPRGAFVLDMRQVPRRVHESRALLLWMLAPSIEPPNPMDGGLCTEGCFVGPTRMSLVDTKKRLVINTVEIRRWNGYEMFLVPYEVALGYGGDARPTFLRDCNGDAKALEIPLFDWATSVDLMTSFVGYSESRDAVIRYPVELEIKEGRGRQVVTQYWTEGLECGPDRKSRRWKYTWDTRGRNGCLDRYNISYQPESELFKGSLARQCEEEDGGPPP